MTQPQHRPQRSSFIVHVGDVTTPATLPEWWGAIDSITEARALRFSEHGGNWIEEGSLPSALTEVGAMLTEVSGVLDFDGLADASLAVGNRVLLKPDAQPQDRFAVAVWTADDRRQVGFLPSNVAATVMDAAMRTRTGYGAFVAAEVRDKDGHARRDLSILLGPGVVWAEPAAEGG